MYNLEEFKQAGAAVWPVGGGRFKGAGDMADRRFVATSMVFAFTERGRMREFTAAAGEHVSRAGQALCLWPLESHLVSELDGEPARNYFFDVAGPAVPAVAGCFGMTPSNRVRNPDNPDAAKALFKEIVAAVMSPEPHSPAHFLRRFYELAERCVAETRNPLAAKPETLARKAARLCHSSSLDRLTVASLAETLEVSQNTLIKACRKELGIPPVRLLIQTKLEKARQLLRDSALPVNQVACACGFASPSRFSACFKAEHGAAPGEYRDQQNREDDK